MYYVLNGNYPEEYLEHHGIIGQKWGVRRYQNPDGSLTDKGKKRYYSKGILGGDKFDKDQYDADRNEARTIINNKTVQRSVKTSEIISGTLAGTTTVASGAAIVAGIASGPVGVASMAGLAATSIGMHIVQSKLLKSNMESLERKDNYKKNVVPGKRDTKLCKLIDKGGTQAEYDAQVIIDKAIDKSYKEYIKNGPEGLETSLSKHLDGSNFSYYCVDASKSKPTGDKSIDKVDREFPIAIGVEVTGMKYTYTVHTSMNKKGERYLTECYYDNRTDYDDPEVKQ